MSARTRLLRARAAAADFTLDDADGGHNFCEHARKFSEWAERLVGLAIERESVVALNQAKVLLVDRHFAWLDSIPRRHTALSGRLSHDCVDVVFEATYRRLREAELALSPPPLAVPPLARPVAEDDPLVPLLGVRFGDRMPDSDEGGIHEWAG